MSAFPSAPSHPRSFTSICCWRSRRATILPRTIPKSITLPSLAAVLGISVSQLKRVFHEQIGQSMVRYLTALRIGEAKRLIREGNLTFTQIAERIGIESIYYFSNLFKKQTGMSPTEYEKTLKE